MATGGSPLSQPREMPAPLALSTHHRALCPAQARPEGRRSPFTTSRAPHLHGCCCCCCPGSELTSPCTATALEQGGED